MYDMECDKLARHFLIDDTRFQGATYEMRVTELAQCIQDQIELWMNDYPYPPPKFRASIPGARHDRIIVKLRRKLASDASADVKAIRRRRRSKR